MNWLLYTIPPNKRLHYAICLYLILLIIPEYILGITFTVVGQFINFITYDILYYNMLKFEKKFMDDDDE
jgi:hypothetical protein